MKGTEHAQSAAGGAFTGLLFPPDAFARDDESDDRLFYARDRFVQHLDRVALETVEALLGDVIAPENPVILDLMAGWDSHLPAKIRTGKIVGLGLNENELNRNAALSEKVIHDLNRDPHLPFPDNTFDAVVNTVSVDYMTQPVEVFREIGRVLKPGGRFIVIFSNRMFPQKATKIWVESSEEERIQLVENFFKYAGGFEEPELFVSKGKRRPADDRYAHLGIPSDPVYALHAARRGEQEGAALSSARRRSAVTGPPPADVLKTRMAEIKDTLSCPYCGERMRKWLVPNTPFSTWDSEHMYVCINDECGYLVRGWDVMNRQGNRGISYRLMYNPVNDRCMAIPVPSLDVLKDGIVD